MKKTHAMTILLGLAAAAHAALPIVIAHRGASGYLPEHSFAAKAFAHAQKPDYLEQDVTLTRDDVPVILHDHYLDTVTDVARVFPGRHRPDGRYYAIDFTAAEIARLTLHERIDLATGKPVYPQRFPVDPGLDLHVPTLDQEIRFIEGMNKSTGRHVGLYTELKVPWWHHREGHDIERATMAVLGRHGYLKPGANIWIQCFDPACLKRLRNELGVRLPMVQLIGHNDWNETPGVDYDAMLTPQGLAAVARYAEGIGPDIDQLIIAQGGTITLRTALVKRAHELGLVLHPYTVRLEELPAGVTSVDRYFDLLFQGLHVDGVFSDFPDLAVQYLQRKGMRP